MKKWRLFLFQDQETLFVDPLRWFYRRLLEYLIIAFLGGALLMFGAWIYSIT